jgi:P27 family predicted phage terminase small subunit
MPRERKPLEVHALQNTKPQYVVDENPLPPGRPKYPRGISRPARKVFKRLCGLLEKRRALTEGDSELLRLYCIVFDRHEQAMAKVTEEGLVVGYHRLNNRGEDVVTEKPNLHLKFATDAERQMVAIIDRLGLTPLNRGKVVPTEVPKAEVPKDALEQLLERGGEPAPAPAADPLEGLEDLPIN